MFDHGLSLLSLVLFFLDETLEIWENIVLILIYGIYCLVVTFSGKMKNCIIRKCSKASETGNVAMEDIANPDSDNMVSTIVAELHFLKIITYFCFVIVKMSVHFLKKSKKFF